MHATRIALLLAGKNAALLADWWCILADFGRGREGEATMWFEA